LNNTFGWVLESGCEEGCVCPEPDADPGTEESPTQEGNYFTGCVQCRDDDDCDGGHCCDGVCQEDECGCEGPCDGDPDCSEGCVCVDGECVAEGFCCFKALAGQYSFTLGGTSGTLDDGAWDDSPESLSVICTSEVIVCGTVLTDGLFFNYFDGTHSWQGFEAGNAFTYPCESSQSLVGTYTLTNCTTNATVSLVIT
jgi:hypothetical protein